MSYAVLEFTNFKSMLSICSSDFLTYGIHIIFLYLFFYMYLLIVNTFVTD